MDSKLQLWQQCKLKDVAYLHKDQVNPVVLGDILVYHYSIPAFDEGQVPKQESAENIKSNKFSVPPDAVLLSKLNPRFPRVWLPQIDPTIKSLASTEFLILRPQANTDRRFLKFLCSEPVFMSKLLERVTGTSSSHQRVRPDDVLTIEVDIPPLPEQRAIVAILGALDDKIEVNRQINQTLEAMAQALFKSWFVDFEPFRDHGVEDSTIGPIPRGWRVAELRDLCKVAIGGDWGHDEPFEGAVKATCLRGVDLEHLRRDGWADAPQRWFKKGSLDKRRLTDKDVLIAASGIGPLGRPLWVHPLLSSIFPLPLLYSNFCKRFITPSPHHAVYVEQISEILKQALPKAFQSKPPDNEHEVQDAVDAALAAAQFRLNRELPLMPFASVSTKPDFSKSEEGTSIDWLFVEMKYPKTKKRLTGVITEITSRIHIYRYQGAYVLFGVYDPNRTIVDDSKFMADLQGICDNVWVSVIR